MPIDRDLHDIEAACLAVFGRDIDVAPRALQVLNTSLRTVNVFGHNLALHSDLECFRRVLAASPACTDAILRNDISLKSLVPSQEPRAGLSQLPRLGRFKALLEGIFVSRFPFKSGLHKAGQGVLDSGVLTETDLFIGCLQAGRRSVLPNQTARALLEAAGLSADGDSTQASDRYLSKLEMLCKSVIATDKSHAEQQVVLYLDSKERIRLQIFGASAVGQLEDRLTKMGSFVFRGGVIQPAPRSSLFSHDAILRLEDLINSKTALERDFQQFFELHPEFLKTLDFSKVHAQPILYKDDGSRLIPDFFLEQADCGWHAIADLKRPHDDMVIRRKNRTYFSQWVQESIAQLQFYKEWFENSRNREIFEQTQKLSTKVYRPKMVLIAGRSSAFEDEVERIRLLSAQDPNLTLWTYDDVLRRAKTYRQFAEG